MKTAILTTQHANNYGAILQTYALQKAITDLLDTPCDVLDYKPDYVKNNSTIFYKNTNIRNIVRNLVMLSNYGFANKKRIRGKVNAQFVRDHIQLSPHFYGNSKQMEEANRAYRTFVCGSDQIWNTSLFPDTTYFLDFVNPENRRIAYAASMLEPVKDSLKEAAAGCLKRFDALSVREREDVDTVCELSGKSCERVCDPVFLHSLDFWGLRAKKPGIAQPYIFCYFLGGENAAEPIVRHLKKLTGYRVAAVGLGYKPMKCTDIDFSDADPFAFIGLIQNAGLVCTNSFHCTAFSLIFRKDFYIMAQNSKRSMRMDNILMDFGIEGRYLDTQRCANLTAEDIPIDYSRAQEAHSMIRSHSLAYLRKALREHE